MVFGPATGRPKSAVFRTADVVGLDTLLHVTNNCYDALPNDERRDVFAPSPVLQQLIAKKWLGAKTKQGFYKKVGDDILQLDLKTLEYGPQKKPRFDSIGATRGVDDVDEKLRRMVGRQRPRRRARAHRALRDADLLGQPPGRDRRQRRRHRPRAALGLRLGARAVRDLGRAGREGDRREDGGRRLHRARLGEGADRRAGRRHALLPAGRRRRASRASSASAAASRRSRPTRARCRSTRSAPPAARSSATASASILDLGDGVFCLEFHAKMNAIDPDIVAMVMKAVDRAERDGVALVIGNDAPDAFCAGANLFGLMMALGQGNMKVIDQMVVDFQNAFLRTRYARVPVVARAVRPGAGRRRRGGAGLPGRARRGRALRRLRRGRRRPDPGGRRLHGDGGPRVGARHRRSAVRHPVARPRAVPRARDRARLDQRRGGARHRLPPAGRQHLDGARDADRRRQADRARPRPRRLPPAPAPPHPRHRRGRPGDAQAGAHQPPGRAPDHRPRRRGLRPPRPRRCRAARSPRARRSASSTSSTSSARRSSRCAGNRRPATASNTCCRRASLFGTEGTTMREVAILSAVRTAIGRAPRGVFKNTRPDDLAALVAREAMRRAEVEPGDHRGRRARLRAPRGRAGPERRPPGRLPGRPARQRPGDDHQPLLLVRACRRRRSSPTASRPAASTRGWPAASSRCR